MHAENGHKVDQDAGREYNGDDEEDEEQEEDFTRELSGASVCFGEFGQPAKVSLPTDFSLACITGLKSESTPTMIIDVLRDISFNIGVDCVRIIKSTALSGPKAVVKVEDPGFAKDLSARLKCQGSVLSAAPMPISARRTTTRKVYISWHKATRTVWLNFGNGNMANRVAEKFNEGKYKCLGQYVRSSVGKESPGRGSRGRISHNALAWTITLSNVPSRATKDNIEKSVFLPHDRPRHIELAPANYGASEAEVSAEIRLRLEEHGSVEDFEIAHSVKGKRVKALAWFQEEADAKSACCLNNEPLPILGKGKLTVTLVQSAKFKLYTSVYNVLRSKIEEESKTWKQLHLTFHSYPDTAGRFTTLKIQGENAANLTKARKILDEIRGGVVLTNGDDVIWSSSLANKGAATKKLRSIEKTLGVVISRDKPKRQLRYHGSPEKLLPAVSRISEMLREEALKSYVIDLEPQQFTWAIHGGFNYIEQALGHGLAVFDVVTRTITITGSGQQYKTALAVMDGKFTVASGLPMAHQSQSKEDCPICFLQAQLLPHMLRRSLQDSRIDEQGPVPGHMPRRWRNMLDNSPTVRVAGSSFVNSIRNCPQVVL